MNKMDSFFDVESIVECRSIIIIMLALVSMGLYAQQRLTVRDSLTQKPIAYTSVWFGNETGGYTDESGMIEIPEGTKQIRVSHICYETKSIAKVTTDLQTIFLVPKSINLDEVAISAKGPKRIKTTEVELMKTKTQTKHKGANGFEMALFIPYDSTWTETPYIHSILASLDYSTHYLVFTEIKTPIYATLRFDLRLPDVKSGAPKDESLRRHSLQSKAVEPSAEAWIGCENKTNPHIRAKRHKSFIKAGHHLPNSV